MSTNWIDGNDKSTSLPHGLRPGRRGPERRAIDANAADLTANPKYYLQDLCFISRECHA